MSGQRCALEEACQKTDPSLSPALGRQAFFACFAGKLRWLRGQGKRNLESLNPADENAGPANQSGARSEAENSTLRLRHLRKCDACQRKHTALLSRRIHLTIPPVPKMLSLPTKTHQIVKSIRCFKRKKRILLNYGSS